MNGVGFLILMIIVIASSSYAEKELLKPYEANVDDFKEIEIGNKIVYFQERTIGEALVEKDSMVYQFDKENKTLISKKIKWRNDLPDKLPKIITQQEAESLATADILYSTLYYISPDSNVFPVKTKNPCWVVRSIKDNQRIVTIIDAVKGKILGFGLPPPFEGFSLAGADFGQGNCKTPYGQYAANARDWFETMGYDTDYADIPSDAQVQSQIQSSQAALFYELAHGNYNLFHNTCPDTENINVSEVENWIGSYNKIPFTFLGSCDAMCNVSDNTLSYEFRKGQSKGAAVVGYCHMANVSCEPDCWPVALDWQNAFFNYAINGLKIKDAFDNANADYPQCINDGWECMRFVGDQNLRLIPKLNREPKCGDAVKGDTWLTDDLFCTGTGLVIDQNNITLDCQGHEIRGGHTGIGIQNINNHVTIKNCTISDFDFGIYMHFFADNNILLNNNITGNDIYGVYFDSISNYNYLNSNSICFNGNDIVSTNINYGLNNGCDFTLNYNDLGAEGCLKGCEYAEFAMNLTKGWNLMSIPLKLENYSADNIFADLSYSALFSFDREWIVPSTLDNKKGMWIEVENESTLAFQGYIQKNVAINLSNGWNLVGHPYLKEMNSSTLGYGRVLTYTNHSWKSYKENKTLNLKPGFGYWIAK
jgi:hypothetical protein